MLLVELLLAIVIVAIGRVYDARQRATARERSRQFWVAHEWRQGDTSVLSR